jgi:hypothetical protein
MDGKAHMQNMPFYSKLFARSGGWQTLFGVIVLGKYPYSSNNEEHN